MSTLFGSVEIIICILFIAFILYIIHDEKGEPFAVAILAPLLILPVALIIIIICYFIC